MDKKLIEVKTPFGTLCAEIGGDEVNYPEIFTYLRRDDGAEIDLVAAGVDVNNGNVKGYIYGDTSREDYTDDVFWTREEINIEIE
jgi:hypothetical protein